MPDNPAADGASFISKAIEAGTKLVEVIGGLITGLGTQYATPMMIVFLLVVLGIIVYYMIAMEKNHKKIYIEPIKINENVDFLKKEIDEANKKILKRNAELNDLRNNPNYDFKERLYFNINGIVNSIFVMGIFLLFINQHASKGGCREAMSKLVPDDIQPRFKSDAIKIATKAVEQCNDLLGQNFSHILSALVVAATVSAIFIFIMPKQEGRSIHIMNKAAVMSGLISALIVAAFTLNPEFVSAVKASWQ